MNLLRVDSTPETEPPPGGPDASLRSGLLDRDNEVSYHCVRDVVSPDSRGSVARHSYPQYRLLETAREISLLNGLNHRVEMCGLYPLPDRDAEIVRHENGKHGFSGLMRCGSGWVCPTCRARIASEKSGDIEMAISAAGSFDIGATMLTLTSEHSINDTFQEIRDDFTESMKDVFAGGSWDRMSKEMGYEGRIRVYEVKYSGTSGFHLHAHVLLFHRHDFDADAFFRRWQNVTKKRGRTANRAGFDAQPVLMDRSNAARTASYLAKVEALNESTWTIGDEMTADHAKNGFDSETPEELLERAGHGDVDAIEAWTEYVRGTKGLNRIRWSPGLRKKLGLKQDERSDEEIANDNEKKGEKVRTLSISENFALVTAKMRVRLLRAADVDGLPGIERVIAEAMIRVYGKRRTPFAA